MKISGRETGRTAGRFSVSVPSSQIKRVQSALNYLEEHVGPSISQAVINAIFAAAKKAGWKDDTGSGD